ncbi:MAG: hypothetical protein NTX50_14835, partial [Candidatus Sumerlaeota bacterium]|nr:hypothetical protein [Candidatus Sumerlaeota bacterium]
CQTTIESSLFVHYRVIHAPQDVFALPSLPVPNRILCAHFARLKAYENFIMEIINISKYASTHTKMLFNSHRGKMFRLDQQRSYLIIGTDAVGVHNEATTTPRMCRLNLETQQIKPWDPPLDLETSRIVQYSLPCVVNPEKGPLYFTAEYLDAGTTQSRIYRCDHLDAKPVVVASYPPPFQIPAPGGRYPFDYLTQALHFRKYSPPLNNKIIKIPYRKTYNTGDMKHAYTGRPDANPIYQDWEIWSGTIEQWNENKPCLDLCAGTCFEFNPAGLGDFKRLARFRNSENLFGWSIAVSPDGKFVIFGQSRSDSNATIEEALMAVDINTGACTPILLHEVGDHADGCFRNLFAFVYQ